MAHSLLLFELYPVNSSEKGINTHENQNNGCCFAAKSAGFICRKMGRQGVTWAGKIALKINPHILEDLSSQIRGKIFVTCGTNGKTTTKELISAVLSQTHNILYTQGNLNNHIGVPTTLLRLKPEHDLAVIEMGANHQGEIKFLCEIAEPDYGIITNVGKAHLEGFGSFEGVIKTKGELYDFLRKKDAITFIHHDNPY